MLVDKLIGIVAPFSCVACGREGCLVCQPCRLNLANAKGSSCFLCNRLTAGFRVCNACRPKTQLRGVMVASHYQAQVKTLIRLLKYERAVAAAGDLGGLLANHINNPSQFDVVTAIPAASQRFRQRGYNQAKLIARQLAKHLHLPFAELLGRCGHSRQVGTTRQRRFKQAQGTMYPRHPKRIRGCRVLVVDDVVTTGATMNEAGRVLKSAGAKYVWGAAVAKH